MWASHDVQDLPLAAAATPLSTPNFLGLRFQPRRSPRRTGNATLDRKRGEKNFSQNLLGIEAVFHNFFAASFFDTSEKTGSAGSRVVAPVQTSVQVRAQS